MMRAKKIVIAGLAAIGLAISAATATMAASLPNVPMQKSLGKGEGALNIVVWAGYAENGSTDKAVDWVNPFTKATGCKVNAKTAGTSDEMVSLMKSGGYDGVSASGDASLRLIYGGQVAPVNTSLFQTTKTYLRS
jgi:putative spermidine/putrescine transport system substrate-binding protein